MARANQVPVLLVVATDIERKAVLRLFTGDRCRGYSGQQTYYHGTFGAYPAVLTTTEMGAIGRDSVILSVQQAITELSPSCVIMIGIAFGKDASKQHIGQVLVASQVISYEGQRIGDRLVYRGPKAESNGILKNRFRTIDDDDWDFLLPNGERCERTIGPLLSGEKLIDDPTHKAQLFDAFPDAIGGEMESAGLYAVAARSNTPWIAVKAICDWADGRKHKEHQPLAAATAASLVYTILSKSYALEGIVTSAK